jgi:hypothetical protein
MNFLSSRMSRCIADVFCFVLGSLFSTAALANCAAMFRTADDGWNARSFRVPSLALGVTIEQTDRWLASVVPLAVTYVWAVALPLATLAHAARETRRSRSRVVAAFRAANSVAFLAAGVLFVGVSARPMASLFADAPGTGGAVAFAASLPPATPFDDSIARFVAKTHVSNGYGLFRRVTGVGPRGETARLEIAVEVSYDDDGSNWIPLAFKHKPGRANVAPRFVAPLQPRLDWQMWFAALGTYRENPWFVHFLVRLLRGTPEAWRLLRVSEGAKSSAPPKFIRATRRAYDFAPRGEEHSRAWWTVADAAEQYLPAFSLDNESVLTFLEARGFARFEGGDEKAADERLKVVGAAREKYGSTAVLSAATVLGFALAGTLIVSEAAAMTVLRSFVVEESHEDAKSRARRRTISRRRGKTKAE